MEDTGIGEDELTEEYLLRIISGCHELLKRKGWTSLAEVWPPEGTKVYLVTAHSSEVHEAFVDEDLNFIKSDESAWLELPILWKPREFTIEVAGCPLK